MTDQPKSSDAPKGDAVVRQNPDDPKSAPVLDFASFDEATAQAKALGKGATVEHIGTAFHVNTDSD